MAQRAETEVIAQLKVKLEQYDALSRIKKEVEDEMKGQLSDDERANLHDELAGILRLQRELRRQRRELLTNTDVPRAPGP
ncbi:MAG TPA: hypothetical protein VEL28_15240 [Candidatus Binatia bacterium]|nr:hypothetical protein [Candidatus Binatia bacterium]